MSGKFHFQVRNGALGNDTLRVRLCQNAEGISDSQILDFRLREGVFFFFPV